jgi:hypothetical protein
LKIIKRGTTRQIATESGKRKTRKRLLKEKSTKLLTVPQGKNSHNSATTALKTRTFSLTFSSVGFLPGLVHWPTKIVLKWTSSCTRRWTH